MAGTVVLATRSLGTCSAPCHAVTTILSVLVLDEKLNQTTADSSVGLTAVPTKRTVPHSFLFLKTNCAAFIDGDRASTLLGNGEGSGAR